MTNYPWKNMNVVPMADIEMWHQYEAGVSGHNIIYDYSGKNRTITCGAGNAPVLTPNVYNSQPGWYFNGSRDPLAWSGSVTLKHVFILMSLDEATFTTERGVLSGLTAGDILVTNSSGTYFYDLSADTYRKSDVVYPAASQSAPVNGAFALVEIVYNAGVSMDGLQVGKQRTLARNHKGYFFEQLGYSGIKNDFERLRIYRYFAMRYQAWPKVASGLNVFPFPADRVNGQELDREHYLSEPYDGDLKALVRGDFKSGFECPFTLRIEPEYNAAVAFYKEHYPLTNFILRDYRYIDPRDTQVRFGSSVKEQGSNVTYRFNYTFDTIQTA